jgi:hypothetical protein
VFCIRSSFARDASAKNQSTQESWMSSYRALALVLSAALLGGCAIPMRVSLTPEQRASIKELDTKVVVVQDEVIVDVKPSGVAGAGLAFGLIGTLISTTIDSSVTNSRVKTAQDLMGPFYLAIEDVDFRKEFNDAIRPGLAGYPIKVAEVTTTPVGLSNARLRTWRDELKPGQNLMLIFPRYLLSADFRTLDSETWVTIWKKDGDDKAINRGVLRYQSAPVGPGGKDSIIEWSANNAAAFRAAIKEAVAETVSLVRADLDVAVVPDKPENTRDFAVMTDGQQTVVKGRLISESASRWVALGADGKMYSLPKLPVAAKN